MNDFTFILMVYNLSSTNSLLSTEQIQVSNVLNQLTGIDTTGISFVTIENLPRASPDGSRNYNNTLVFNISGDGINEPNRELLFKMGKVNVGDADGLAGILLMIKERCPANKYVILTFDHSNFIGHLLNNLGNRTGFRRSAAFTVLQAHEQNILQGKPATGITEAILSGAQPEEIMRLKKSLDDLPRWDKMLYDKDTYDKSSVSKQDMLTNAELANALYKVFNLNARPGESGRVEAIFFDTCYTSCIDNLYLYGNVVNYMVSSQGEMNYNSINIKKVIGYFLGNKHDTKAVINLFFKNFETDFKSVNTGAIALNDLQRMVLAGVKLGDSFQENLRELFNPLVMSLINDIVPVYDTLSSIGSQAALQDCFNIYEKKSPVDLNEDPSETYSFCVDLVNFFTLLKQEPALAHLVAPIDALLSFLNCNQFEVFTGLQVDPSFKGLAIFLPPDVNLLGEKKKEQVAYNYSPFSDFQNDFARQTPWPEFLQLFNKMRQATGFTFLKPTTPAACHATA